MNDMARNLVLWIIIAVVLMLVFQNFGPRHANNQQLDYSRFVAEVKSGRVSEVEIDEQLIKGRLSDGVNFYTYNPETDNTALIGLLLDKNVLTKGAQPDEQGPC